jgi:hypothetical protein
LALALIATVAFGDDKSRMRASLSTYEEVPSISSTGSGRFVATIDDDAQQITYTLTYENLSGPPLFSHIHLGQRGANGGVAVFLCGGGGKPACPVATSGTVTGTISPANIVGPAGQGLTTGEWAELVAAIRAGVTYANIHTPSFPSGETRGQINDRSRADAD